MNRAARPAACLDPGRAGRQQRGQARRSCRCACRGRGWCRPGGRRWLLKCGPEHRAGGACRGEGEDGERRDDAGGQGGPVTHRAASGSACRVPAGTPAVRAAGRAGGGCWSCGARARAAACQAGRGAGRGDARAGRCRAGRCRRRAGRWPWWGAGRAWCRQLGEAQPRPGLPGGQPDRVGGPARRRRQPVVWWWRPGRRGTAPPRLRTRAAVRQCWPAAPAGAASRRAVGSQNSTGVVMPVRAARSR